MKINFSENIHEMMNGQHVQIRVQNGQTNDQHAQMCGMASYDEKQYFLFTPDNPVVGSIPPFRGLGIAQLLSDGTFDFVRRPQLKAQSELIRKLAHGRVSKTKDGAIQLTLKVYQHEGIDIAEAIGEEAEIACQAIREYQMKR